LPKNGNRKNQSFRFVARGLPKNGKALPKNGKKRNADPRDSGRLPGWPESRMQSGVVSTRSFKAFDAKE
jgi:hypothetical protein